MRGDLECLYTQWSTRQPATWSGSTRPQPTNRSPRRWHRRSRPTEDGRKVPRWRSGPHSSVRWPPCTPNAGRHSPRSSTARWARRSRGHSARSTLVQRSTSTTPTTPRSSSPTSRSTCSTARAARSSAAARWAYCWASCRGTIRTTRSPDSPVRIWCWATRSCSSMRPSAPSRLRRFRRSTTMPASRQAPTSTSTPPTIRSPPRSPTHEYRGCR